MCSTISSLTGEHLALITFKLQTRELELMLSKNRLLLLSSPYSDRRLDWRKHLVHHVV